MRVITKGKNLTSRVLKSPVKRQWQNVTNTKTNTLLSHCMIWVMKRLEKEITRLLSITECANYFLVERKKLSLWRGEAQVDTGNSLCVWKSLSTQGLLPRLKYINICTEGVCSATKVKRKHFGLACLQTRHMIEVTLPSVQSNILYFEPPHTGQMCGRKLSWVLMSDKLSWDASGNETFFFSDGCSFKFPASKQNDEVGKKNCKIRKIQNPSSSSR